MSALGRFNWYPWARFQGIGAGFFILTGGVISLFYPNLIVAIGNIILGLFIIALDKPWFPFNKLGPLSTSFWIRGVLYLAAVVPTFLQAPTITGGLCLACAGLTYLRAAINGESWSAPKPRGRGGDEKKDLSAIKAPTQ